VLHAPPSRTSQKKHPCSAIIQKHKPNNRKKNKTTQDEKQANQNHDLRDTELDRFEGETPRDADARDVLFAAVFTAAEADATAVPEAVIEVDFAEADDVTADFGALDFAANDACEPHRHKT